MWYELIAKHFVHLLQGAAFRLWVEDPVADERDDVEDEENVEVLELNRAQSLRRELCEDKVDRPVGKRRNGVTKCAALNREDF